jgi:hypothetical protein
LQPFAAKISHIKYNTTGGIEKVLVFSQRAKPTTDEILRNTCSKSTLKVRPVKKQHIRHT